MGDNFNLDELKLLISNYENNNLSDESEADKSTELEPQEVSANKNNIGGSVALNGEISSDIVRPEGMSITDTFEAVKNEKNNSSSNNDENSDTADFTAPVKSEADDYDKQDGIKPSVEIKAEIDKQRFFDTDQFESIKNKNKNTSELKESITSFAKGVEEQDDGEEEYFREREPTEEIDDFEVPEEREDVILDLKKMNASASFKSFLTLILSAFSCVIFFSLQFGISIPGIQITTGSKLVLTILFVISAIASAVNFNTLFKGFLSLLKFKCTSDSMLFLAFLFNAILDLVYLLGNKSFDGHFVSFDFVYILLLAFNIFSKKLLAKNIYKNFLIASSDGQKTVVDRPEIEELSNDIILETGNGGDILYATKSKFVSDFIHNSFKDFDLVSRSSGFYMFCSISLLVLSVITFIVTGNFVRAIAYAAGSFCVVTPLLYAFSFAVPVYINSKKARRSGGAIVGSDSAYALEDAQTLIVDDSDVFNVSLNGIRLSNNYDIDDCIIYLSSLYNVVGGPLKSLFVGMLPDNTVSLKNVDEIYYHESRGYSCLIDSKVFVVGNKALMDHFEISVDDSEFEIIYQQKSKNVLFVAYNKKLMGVFLLTYSFSHGVSKAFSLLEADQMNVAVVERDANVTLSLLNNSYKSSDSGLFKIIRFKTAQSFFGKFIPQNRTPSILLSNTGLKGIAAAIHGCRAMLFAMKANNVIRIISSLMAIVLFTFLLIFSEPSVKLPLHMLAYHGLWSLPVLFVSLFSK